MGEWNERVERRSEILLTIVPFVGLLASRGMKRYMRTEDDDEKEKPYSIELVILRQ